MAGAFASGLSIVVLGVAAEVSDTQALSTLAAASFRPAICRERAALNQGGLWARTQRGPARAYCDLIARAQARLEGAPDQAFALSERARAVLPNEAAPWVLGARALVRKGEWARAHEFFSRSATKQGQPLGDAMVLREFAIAAASIGRTEQAIELYRRLVPRSDFQADEAFRRVVVLEAASLLLTSGGAGLPEAIVYLSEVHRSPPVPGLTDLTSALLALAYDRQGNAEQARVVSREIGGPWGLERFLSASEAARATALVLSGTPPAEPAAPVFRVRSPMLAEGELHALLGVVAAERDPKLARLHLQAYLQGPGARGPWAEWARGKLLPGRSSRR